MKIPVESLEVFYISYDEPNAEENWSDLLNKVPWAKRIHGVKGFDAAHKAAAEQSETQRFITVDGDNRVYDRFFDQILDVPDYDESGNNMAESIFSWNAKNLINGLVYGNGGLKCWPREYTLSIQTHEASDDDEGMEFCWKLNYIQMNDVYSEIHQAASAFQAFRAGFREGTKMSLDQGKRVKPQEFADKIWYGNFNRLLTWCNVGADVTNGIWAIYGARLGCYKTVFTNWDTNLIADYDWFREFFESTEVQDQIETDADLESKVSELGEILNRDIDGMLLIEPTETSSKFFKQTYVNPGRLGAMVRENQIQRLIEKGLV